MFIPWLERNENEIDEYIERASKKSYTTVMTLGVRGVNMATQVSTGGVGQAGNGEAASLVSSKDVTIYWKKLYLQMAILCL